MPVIVIANPKGGVGKSTLATNVAGLLAHQGHAVMLGDVDRQSLLLFRSGRYERLAVPLSLVARLEEFPRAKIEHAGGQEQRGHQPAQPLLETAALDEHDEWCQNGHVGFPLSNRSPLGLERVDAIIRKNRLFRGCSHLDT